jgi:hypothetical protein
MKKLFISMLAVAALASCSQEDVIVADKGDLIGFNSFVENSTRADAATDPSYTTTGQNPNLTSFNVYGAVNGVNIFNGNTVTKSADYGSAWTCGAKQYWINGADYEFVAVVDGNKTVKDSENNDVVITSTTPNASGIPTAITYNSDGATDLLCARVERKKDADGNTDMSLVQFNFSHLLSKVKFSVKNTTDAAATNYRIELTSAKITGALKSNTYNVGETSAWATVNTTDNTKDFTLENLTVNSAATQYHSKELLLLPGVNVNVIVTANVQATDDGGKNWKTVSTMNRTFNNVLGEGTLVANNAYHFAVSLGIGEEIKFTATKLPDWADGDGADDTPLK